MARLLRPNTRDDFEIAIICALKIERDAIEALLDEEYETDGFSYGKAAGDSNAYTTGRLGNQHVVLVNDTKKPIFLIKVINFRIK